MAHTCTHSTKTELAKEFWAIWREDYLRNLPRNKGVSDLKKTQVGTIVLVESEDWWMEWPMGIVTKMHAGKDRVGRAIEVKTKKGIITRPIQRLHVLEVDSPVHYQNVLSISDKRTTDQTFPSYERTKYDFRSHLGTWWTHKSQLTVFQT